MYNEQEIQVVRVGCPLWEDGELVYEKYTNDEYVSLYWERWKGDDLIRTRLQEFEFPYKVTGHAQLRRQLIRYRFSILKYQTNRSLYPELRFKPTK